MKLRMGLNFNHALASYVVRDVDARRWITPDMPEAMRPLIDNLVTALKGCGFWQRCTWISMLGMHKPGAQLLNIIEPTTQLVKVGYPVMLPYMGTYCDGTSSWLRTPVGLHSMGFKPKDGHVSSWNLSPVDPGRAMFGAEGTDGSIVALFDDAVAPTDGWCVLNYTDQYIEHFFDGVKEGKTINDLPSVPNVAMHFGSHNVQNNRGFLPSSHSIYLVTIGKSVTVRQIDAALIAFTQFQQAMAKLA